MVLAVRRAPDMGVAAAALVLLMACGSGPGPPAQGRSPVDREPDHGVSVETVVDTFNSSREFVDNPATWRQIAASVQLVILGEVLEAGPGRIIGNGPDDPYAEHFAAIKVKVAHVARSVGPHRVVAGDEVWVEIRVEGSALAQAVGPGMNLALLLSNDARLHSPSYTDYTQSILPRGVRVWAPPHGRGILVEPVARGGYVVPYDDLVQPSATMVQFLDLIVPTRVPRSERPEPRGIWVQPYYGVPCDLLGLAAADC